MFPGLLAPAEQTEVMQKIMFSVCMLLMLAQVRVDGLQGVGYLDSLQDKKRFTEDGASVRFSGEVDRIYLATPDRLEVIHSFHPPSESTFADSSKHAVLQAAVVNQDACTNIICQSQHAHTCFRSSKHAPLDD